MTASSKTCLFSLSFENEVFCFQELGSHDFGDSLHYKSSSLTTHGMTALNWKQNVQSCSKVSQENLIYTTEKISMII